MKNTQTLSRHRIYLLRQRKLEAEVNFVATKTNIVATEVEKITKRMLQHRNSSCDRIKN